MGDLELVGKGDRAVVHKALQKLYLTTQAGRIKLPGDELKEAQRVLVMNLAKKLLGEDVSFWEYTCKFPVENYCGYECPVTGLKCCPKNGPCHDCQ